MLSVLAVANADEAADLRQQLDTLKAKIDGIDGDLAASAKSNAEIKDQTDAYLGKVETDKATAQKLKGRSQQLTTRVGELDTENAAAAQICHKTTATADEYKAALAECDKAGDAYRHHADQYRADQESLAADYAAYQAETKQLKTQYDDIEQKRRDLIAQQTALESTRQEAADRFNEMRERLIALQSKPK